MHCCWRRLLWRGLEFHVCIINKSAHTTKVRKLIVYIYIYIYKLRSRVRLCFSDICTIFFIQKVGWSLDQKTKKDKTEITPKVVPGSLRICSSLSQFINQRVVSLQVEQPDSWTDRFSVHSGNPTHVVHAHVEGGEPMTGSARKRSNFYTSVYNSVYCNHEWVNSSVLVCLYIYIYIYIF